MPELTIAPLARNDLKDIGHYTQATWGQNQRDSYLGDFEVVLNLLRTGRAEGRNRSNIRYGLLCYPCNKHMIFFRRDANDNVEILRILHQSMDFEQHL